MWKIRPLHVATIERDQSNFTYLHGAGKKVKFPVIAWLVYTDKTQIMVDTGCSDLSVTHNFHLPMEQEMTLAQRLEGEGVNPDSIKTVILTHLHWDHCYNNKLFPNAEFVVQKRELEYSVAPYPLHYKSYESPQIGLIPPYMGSHVRTVSGDAAVCEGVDLLFTPGHSPGSQSVVVRTAAGAYILAGDTVPTYDNWEGNESLPHIPDGAHLDLSEYWRSFERLESTEAVILPSHDPQVLGKTFGTT
jgi:N-acyl homoserine lactone hydrolase